MVLPVVFLQMILMFRVMGQDNGWKTTVTVNVKSGDHTAFPCRRPPSSNTGDSTSWYIYHEKGQSQLKDDNRRFTDLTGTLFFTYVTSSDTGLYQCAINSRDSIKLGSPVQLTVSENSGYNNKPPYLTWSSNNTEVQLYEQAELECVFVGKPPPAVYWQHNGKRIRDSRRLQIGNVSLQDSGDYTCVGENTAGKHNATMRLRVIDTSIKKPVTTPQGDDDDHKDHESKETTSEGAHHHGHDDESTTKTAESVASASNSNVPVIAVVIAVVVIVIVGVVIGFVAWKRRQIAKERRITRATMEKNEELVLEAERRYTPM